jgi:hypothetical protein
MPVVIVKKDVEIDIQEELEDDREEGEEELEKTTLNQMEIQISTSSLNKGLRIGDDRTFIGTIVQLYFILQFILYSSSLFFFTLIEF